MRKFVFKMLFVTGIVIIIGTVGASDIELIDDDTMTRNSLNGVILATVGKMNVQKEEKRYGKKR